MACDECGKKIIGKCTLTARNGSTKQLIVHNHCYEKIIREEN